MAIVQISKLTQRSGNLVDLPQLSEAEFGWASDEKRLFIGKETPNENVEVLTSYSRIDFSQIEGSVGNLNISPVPLNGQVLAYDGTNWVNRGRGAAGLLTFGDISNVKIDGGAIGYVLQTDGLGNLSWTPKGTLFVNILDLSDDTPVVMTVDPTTPYSNDIQVTISGVNGSGNSIVNGQTFYVQLSNDYPTSGNVFLYEGVGATTPVVGTGLTYTNSPEGVATSVFSSGSGGVAGGSDTTVQFNKSGLAFGDADFTFNYALPTKLLTVNGNAAISNLAVQGISSASSFISNVTTGTAPLQVTSTTRVANLNVSYANVSDFNVVTNQTVGVFYPALVSNNATGNRALSANVNLSFNAGNGLLSTSELSVTGNISGGNISTTDTVSATGNISGGNISTTGELEASTLTSTVITGTAPLSVTSTTRVDNLNVSHANVSDYVAVEAQSSGDFYPVFVTGTTSGNYELQSNSGISFNAATGLLTVPTIQTSGNITGLYFIGNGSSLTDINGSNVTGEVGFSATSNSVSLSNVAGAGNIASLNLTGNSSQVLLGNGVFGDVLFPIPTQIVNGSSNVVATLNSNVTVGVSGTANVVVITNTGTIINGTLSVTGNANTGNLGTNNIVSTGTLSVAGNANTGNLGTNNIVSTGTLSVTGNANTGNLGTNNIVLTGNVTGNTAGFALGYRDIPQLSLTTNTTIPTTAAGKHYYSTSSSNLILTIANSSVSNFAIGAVVNIINRGTGTITIAQGSGVSLYLVGDNTPSNRTLVSYGMATLQKVENDIWFIVGAGVD